MYKFLIRPLLFLLPPETIHVLLVRSIRFLFHIPGVKQLVSKIYSCDHPSLKREFLGLQFKNPVGLSAGFDKNGEIYNEFSSFGFSHIEVGTVTPKGQPGNEKPRSFRLPNDKALINRMGFNNNGIHSLVKKIDRKRPKSLILGGNIGKNTLTPNSEAVSDYVTCFRELYNKVDYFVVNVSCPNISDLHELQDQEGLERILSALSGTRKEQNVYVPILLKISPDLNYKQIDVSLEIVKKFQIDGIVATNTTVSRKGLTTEHKTVERIGNGGLSGKPLTNRSVEVVRYLNQKTGGKMPIIGVGGIMTVTDAINMLDAGATLIQIYTGFIYNGPGFIKKINKALIKNYIESGQEKTPV